jgi:ketosteroid isomerase-like protein
MKGLAFFVLGAVIGLIVGALWIGPERVGELSDQSVAAVEGAGGSYSQSFEANDWQTFVTLYADDAVVMPPNAPVVQGRAAMSELTANWPQITTFSLAVDEIDGCRDLAFSRGSYTFAAMLEGVPEPVEDVGKYIEIWRRQPDGTWLIAAEIWNSDNPPFVPAETGE